MLLEERSVLITGAGSGIGRALAGALARRGARLILTGRREQALIGSAALLPAGTHVAVVPTDITTAAGRARIVQACRGGLDILINNAGMVPVGPLSELSDDTLQAMVATNIASPIALIRDLRPILRASDRPRVVNIGSIFGDIGHPYFAAYCASKFALRGLSDALRRELAVDGIGVTYVAPRATRTDAASAFSALVKPFGMALDDPEVVAESIAVAIATEARTAYAAGPERLFVLLQRVAPRVIDFALIGKLRRMLHKTAMTGVLEPPSGG